MNRRETGEKKDEKPFYRGQKINTIRKYSAHWVKILRYIWRTYEKEEKAAYRLTSRQGQCLQAFKAVANRDDEVSQIDAVEDENRTAPSSPGEKRMGRQKQLDCACMEFWIAMFDDELKDSDYESGIVSVLTVLGLKAERGGWRPVNHYTPILSAIVMVTGALVIYKAWHKREDAVRQLQREGWQESDARWHAQSIFSQAKKMVHRFMTLTGAHAHVRVQDWHGDRRRGDGDVAGREDMHRADSFHDE